MPIYEYDCNHCHKTTEAIQKFSDSALTDCPECHQSGSLQRRVSLSSFSLKGTGWYATDYKKASSATPVSPKKESTDAPADAPKAAAAPPAASTSSDSK